MRFRKVTTFVTLAAAASLVAAGCSSSKSGGSSGGSSESLSADCAAFSAYTGNKGTVTMYSSITDPEGGYLQQSWKQFESCTGIKIAYTADKSFETQLKIKVQGGNAPDIAIIPQPGLIKTFVDAGKLKPATDALTELAKKNWSEDWICAIGRPIVVNLLLR